MNTKLHKIYRGLPDIANLNLPKDYILVRDMLPPNHIATWQREVA